VLFYYQIGSVNVFYCVVYKERLNLFRHLLNMSWGSTFCLITGASRGIGQAIAVELSKKLGEGSVLLLLARTQSGLDETKKLVEEINNRVQVHPVAIDLQKAAIQEYKSVIVDSLKNVKVSTSTIQRATLIHNVGGFEAKLALKLDNASALQNDLNLNFVSPILLNTQFCNIFNETTKKRTIVQISSGASKVPVPNFSIYCSIKAARNHFFHTLAMEEPSIRVLSYNPGPVDTNLFHSFYTESGDTKEEAYKKFEDVGFPVTQPSESAAVLLEILDKDEFESGAFVNVYKRK